MLFIANTYALYFLNTSNDNHFKMIDIVLRELQVQI